MATKPQFEDPSVQRAFEAGLIDNNGIGNPGEFPRVLFKKGSATDHLLAEKPLKIDNRDITTMTVNNLSEQAEALANGWFFTPDLVKTPDQLKDEELASLRAQVAEKNDKPKTLSVAKQEGE